MNSTDAAVADAGPLIHLDELGWLFVLESFTTVWVPPEVAEEAKRHRPSWEKFAPPNLIIEIASPEAWGWWQSQTRFIQLDKGEQAALALWRTHQDAIMLCDDLQARMVVHHFGIPVMGTIGLILRTAHLSLRPISEVRRILNEIHTRSTLHLKPSLLQRVIDSLPPAK
jgi:predicted nucleic acid-binding protein